jgi:hypothetical protein
MQHHSFNVFLNSAYFFFDQYNTVNECIIYCVASIRKREQILKAYRVFLDWFPLKNPKRN